MQLQLLDAAAERSSILVMDAGEQHLEEGGVAIRRPVVASTVVGGREDIEPPDALVTEASDIQRGGGRTSRRAGRTRRGEGR